MAIVKFTSEKVCQLLIDKEPIGEILTDKMLKISLEPGEYLIEATEANGNKICKYELIIKTNDTQILQDLTCENNHLENTIENLKKDSSLQFFNQRSLFKHNNMFGYIDSQYKVVIPAIYSYAEEFKSDKAIVRKKFPDGEKITVIDIDGNICLNQWYDYIGCGDKTLLLKKNNVFYVLSREDYSLLNEYTCEHYDEKKDLIPVYKELGVDDFYGFIDKTGIEVIPFIYDYVWNFEDNGFAKVKRFGNTYAVGKDGTLFFSMAEAIKDGRKTKKVESLFEISDDLIFECNTPKTSEDDEVYNALKLKKEESLGKGFYKCYYDYTLDCETSHTPVKEKGKWYLKSYEKVWSDEYASYMEDETKPIYKYCCDRIIYYTGEYLIYRTDGICNLLNLRKPDKTYSFDADEVTLNIRWEHTCEGQYDTKTINNVIIKKNRKYGIASLNGVIILPIEYDKIITSEAIEKYISGNIGIIWKNNLCALVQMTDGKILSPFKYEEIAVNESIDTYKDVYYSTYLFKENGKYGCMDFFRQAILQPKYDSIDFIFFNNDFGKSHYKLILHKDGKVGTCEFYKFGKDVQFTVEPDYDECVFLDNEKAITSLKEISYIAVRKDNKWGIIDNTPNDVTYYPLNERDWSNNPNLKDLEFKYNTLEELKDDADAEFDKRFQKYYRPHTTIQIGDNCIVSDIFDNDGIK